MRPKTEFTSPKLEVANWSQVFPAPPIRSDDEAMVESPVPPFVAASVPLVSLKLIPREEVDIMT
jgi:hypothetical protein